MRQSMTGYASGQGSFGTHRWGWEIRGVNGKGLELRMRLPDWIDGLEPLLKAQAQQRLSRGNVQVSLRIQAEEDAAALTLNEAQLSGVLRALARIEAEAKVAGLTLAAPSPAEIAGLRGVMETGAPDIDVTALRGAIAADFATVLTAFAEMRRAEGAALQSVLGAQLDTMMGLVAAATEAAEARRDGQADRLRAALARVTASAAEADPQRVAQELALIAVKSDITEEIDRLTAHIAAARDLLATDGPVGRKLDFLMQEFNREANTLCAKAQSTDLTQIGLDLKGVIDQMREQVQNVE